MDYKSLLKTLLLSSTLIVMSSNIFAEPSDYDVQSSGDYDVPSESPSQSNINNTLQNNSSEDNNLENDYTNPDLAEAESNSNPHVKNANKEIKAYQKYDKNAKVAEKPSVDQFGLFRPGLIKNSDGTQTVINPPSTPTDPATFGANVPPPPRGYDAGSPTGDLKNLSNTFIEKKTSSTSDDNSNDDADKDDEDNN